MKIYTNIVSSVAAAALAGSSSAATVIAQYSLAGNSNDSSGNSFNGVDTDIAYVADIMRGTVASFNGTSSSIDVSASGYSVTEAPNFQFAISFWIKPTPRQDYVAGGAIDTNVLMGAPGSGVIEIVGQGSWGGMGNSTAYGGIGVNSGGGAGSTGKVPGINIYDGAWHHVVIQWEDPDGSVAGNVGADASVYIDSILADDLNSNTYNGNGSTSPSMVLGGPVTWSNGGPSNKHYDGLMSDVRFFDSQLTQAEVTALFTGVPEPSSLLLAGLGSALALVRRRR